MWIKLAVAYFLFYKLLNQMRVFILSFGEFSFLFGAPLTHWSSLIGYLLAVQGNAEVGGGLVARSRTLHRLSAGRTETQGVIQTASDYHWIFTFIFSFKDLNTFWFKGCWSSFPEAFVSFSPACCWSPWVFKHFSWLEFGIAVRFDATDDFGHHQAEFCESLQLWTVCKPERALLRVMYKCRAKQWVLIDSGST